MLVRALRSQRRRNQILVVAFAAFGIAAARPGTLAGQQPAAQTPATHTVKRGDTLWDISKTYLGDPFLWPEIYRLNTDIIEDPHWIYPGELLKLPGSPAKVIAVAPPAPEAAAAPVAVTPTPTPTPTAPPPSLVTPAAPRQEPTVEQAASAYALRVGEFAAAPWVDQRGGPRGSGYILQATDIPGIASVDHSRMRLHDQLLIAPPVGDVAPERELYLSYRLGPLIENFGQIVIPTGIIEVTRSARNGEAATGRVVKMFGEVLQDQRLIPYDSSAAVIHGAPSPVVNGHSGKVRWIYNQTVLPSLQDYLVLDISKADVRPGDQIELYQPRRPAREGSDLAFPEVSIGRAQVLRVTAYGATAVITSQAQPKIEEGTAVRVAAKMP